MHRNVDDSHAQPHAAQEAVINNEGKAPDSSCPVGPSSFRLRLERTSASSSANAALESLPVDVWSECLSFLPPRGAAIASSCLCRSLLASSEEAAERAAWLALDAISRRCQSGAEEDGESSSRSPPRPMPPPLRCYVSERWMDLYRLLFVLSENAAIEGSNIDNGVDDAAAGHAIPTGGFLGAGILLLFGVSDLPSPPVALEGIASSLIALTTTRIGDDTKEETPLSERPRWYCCRARIVQAALRLGNSGKWSMASELLNAAAAMKSGGATRRDEGGGPATGGSEHPPATKISFMGGIRREEEVVDEDGDLADIQMCTCSFLVDRLYAGTYVRADMADSNDLSKAVLLGREAVRRSIRRMGGPTSASDGPTTSGDGDGMQIAPGRHSYAEDRSRPPPPAAMHSSDRIRLARARLALARALSLLAQHVGLGATDPREIGVRPLGGGDDDDDGYEALMRPDGVGVRTAEGFFLEGLRVIDSSLAALAGPRSENDAGDDSLDHCEVICATKAARGELFYCAASVNTVGGTVLRQESDDLRVRTIQRLSQSAVDNLKTAFRLGMTRLLREFGEAAAPPTVSNLCSDGALRSLMLLQMHTAKDLGKVHEFALGFNRGDGDGADGKNHMFFAHAVCLRLLGGSHPSAANIERLLYGRPLGLPRGAHADETSVDQWINDVFCA